MSDSEVRVLETDFWSIDLPEEWLAEQDDESIIIADQDGVGQLEITTFNKETDAVSDAELRTFVDEADSAGNATVVKVAALEGYCLRYEEDDESIREWYLRGEQLWLYITYSCDMENQGLDDAAIDAIMATLLLKLPGNS